MSTTGAGAKTSQLGLTRAKYQSLSLEPKEPSISATRTQSNSHRYPNWNQLPQLGINISHTGTKTSSLGLEPKETTRPQFPLGISTGANWNQNICCIPTRAITFPTRSGTTAAKTAIPTGAKASQLGSIQSPLEPTYWNQNICNIPTRTNFPH